MTRLQKKCLLAVAGTHLLLVVVLLCSGFIRPKPMVDDSQVLDVIPSKLVDAAVNSGVRNAQPPPPAVKLPEPQPSAPAPPKPEVKHVEPVKPPPPVKQPEVVKPEASFEPKPKPQPHEVKPNLKPIMHKPTPVKDNSAEDERKAEEAAAKAAQQARDAKVKAIERAARSIRENASSSMTIDMPATLKGDSTVAYANYGNVVISIYTEAWTLPDTAASDETNVKASVTIASDGRVISARILERSGDAAVNRSVQNTLDRVRMIAPFPEGSTDKERTYKINFNLKAKRQMLG